MGAQIDLETNQENFNDRVDFNNSDFANSAIYSPNGNRIFATTNGTSTIWIIDTFNVNNRTEINSGGKSPDDIAISPNGEKLFVHNFMSRNVVVFEFNKGCNNSCGSIEEIKKVNVVTNEVLADNVLNGKQLFYNSEDVRIAQDGYMSCASCHLNGGHDGRTWDISNLGEGFRNTIDLRGKGRKGHGRAHWSSNFDEVQDFENQIRTLSNGSGLMRDSDYKITEGTLGTPKKGKSKDLDDLAAYVKSLVKVGDSPCTNNGELTTKAQLGKQAFKDLLCIRCHGGGDFTDSPSNNLHDVGTLKTTSGMRLGEQLPGIDTPSLRGLWFTEPYLHDGSALTLEAAINAHHDKVTKPDDDTKMDNLVAYLLQISDNECLVNQGTPCNDFDTSTTNDTYNANCECIGEPVDCSATGEIVYERWNNIGGKLVTNLTNNIDYPNNPTLTETMNGLFERETQGNNYGAKAYGILCPPETGDYTFWISGDDWTELHLSTDKYPSNAQIIAHTGGFTGFRNWTVRSSQESLKIPLNANQEYYVHVLHKEGNGGDHFSVGWRLPSGALERPMNLENFSKPVNEVAKNCHITPFFSLDDRGTWIKNNFIEIDENNALILGPQSKEFGATSEGWEWYGPQNFTSNTRQVNFDTIKRDQEGIYTAYHTNQDGCVSVEYFYIDVKSRLSTNDPDIELDYVMAFPNPVKGVLYIQSNKNMTNAKVSVADLNGKQILRNTTLKMMQSSNKMVLKTENWVSGVYLLTIIHDNKKTIKKIVKQ